MYVTGVPSDHYNESVISQDNLSGYLSYSLFVGHMTVRFECVHRPALGKLRFPRSGRSEALRALSAPDPQPPAAS